MELVEVLWAEPAQRDRVELWAEPNRGWVRLWAEPAERDGAEPWAEPAQWGGVGGVWAGLARGEALCWGRMGGSSRGHVGGASTAGVSGWGCISVLTEALEGNGTPLQYSCLENPMDGGAW